MDFDGVLAPIVDDPATSAPLPGVRPILHTLVRRFAAVAVISGRPLAFLEKHLGGSGASDGAGSKPGLHLYGLYGLETNAVTSAHGPPDDPGGAGPHGGTAHRSQWQETADRVAAAARDTVPPGIRVEHKGMAVTLHWRRSPEDAPAAMDAAEDAARRFGMLVRHGKMSVELVPDVDTDKGTVVASLVDRCAAACYFGDDVGDVAAFDALEEASRNGTRVARIAVRDAELPAELASRADIVVDSPGEALDLLRLLSAEV